MLARELLRAARLRTLAALVVAATCCVPVSVPGIPAPPIPSNAARVSVGGPGRGAGQFLRPAGLSFDTFGHLFVSDRGNQRIQEFDEQLRFVREQGGYGFEPGHFVDPRAVVADRGPRVYVLDTPAGRVQTLDSRREPEAVLFDARPRTGFAAHRLISMGVDAAGRIFLSDRESQSILVLGPLGDSLGSRGGYGSGPGQFRRIGGLAAGATGELWVLDEARARLVHLDPAGGFVSEFSVAPDSLKDVSRPSAVAVSARSLLAVADPGLQQVHLYTPEGALLGELQPPDGAAWDRPTALAWWGDTLAVADEGTQRVTLFKPAVAVGAPH